MWYNKYKLILTDLYYKGGMSYEHRKKRKEKTNSTIFGH